MQAFEAGEGGATLGLFTALVSGAAAGGAAAGAEAATPAAEGGIPGGAVQATTEVTSVAPSNIVTAGNLADQASTPIEGIVTQANLADQVATPLEGVVTQADLAAPAVGATDSIPGLVTQADLAAPAAAGGGTSLLTASSLGTALSLGSQVYKLVQSFFNKPASGQASVSSPSGTNGVLTAGAPASDASGSDSGSILDALKKPSALAAVGIGAGALTLAYLVKHKGKAA
jgi:hypothetical protein